MKSLRHWFRLTGGDRRLLVSSLLSQARIRVGLWLMPFSKVQRFALGWATRKQSPGPAGERQVVWAINMTSPMVPSCTCFVRALAAQVLLQRRGFETDLRVGVAKEPNGRLKGHAWLEKSGEVLLDARQHHERSSG